MALKGINRALIYTTLERGLRDMKKDLKRTIRNLTDLGNHFAKTPQQKTVFSLFRSLLQKENSPYYIMIQNLLDYSSEKDLLTLGMNIACNSWIDRKHSNSERNTWIIFPETMKFRDHPEVLDRFITDEKKCGIYSYVLDETLPLNEAFFKLIKKHKDCAFFYLKSLSVLTDKELSSIRDAHNLMMVLDTGNRDNLHNAAKLRTQKSIYSSYCVYKEDVILDTEKLLQPAREFKTAFHIMFADSACPEDVQQSVNRLVKNYRMHPTDPILLMDAYTDAAALEEWLKP